MLWIFFSVCSLPFHSLNNIFWWMEVLEWHSWYQSLSLTLGRPSALGLCARFLGCRLSCPVDPSLLLSWLATESLGGVSISDSCLDLSPLWPQILEARTVILLGDSLPAISIQQSFPEPHPRLIPQAEVSRSPYQILPGSCYAFPPHPTLTGDLWHSPLWLFGKGTLLKIAILLDYNIKLLFTWGPSLISQAQCLNSKVGPA